MDVSLVMFKADGTRRDFAMAKDRMVIGRTSQCDLRIPLSSVSRQHCELRVVDGRLKLRDLGSSNGTYHNSTRVQEAVLQPGDEVVIGPVVFKLIIDGKPERVDAVRTVLESHVTQRPRQPEPAAAPAPKPAKAPPAPAAGAAAPATPQPGPVAPPGQDSPTVDLDDPIAALEALAEAESDISAAQSEGSSIIDLADDDEDDEPGTH
ncbi:MAG: FHA domain-containing protein [Planctomycetes bacterium]|nr:FHA domain-containing protein [Planctomycetota bacterium]